MDQNNLLKSVVIVAGGSGKRMQTNIPKQFLLLNNKPVLMHTIEKFYKFNNDIEIVLVLPENQIDYWALLCKDYKFNINHSIALGGKERFHSVKNGLEKIQNQDSYVAIHDGVRPLVDNDLLSRGIIAVQKFNAVVPVIFVTSSLRDVSSDVSKHVDRKNLRIVQTPQIFDYKIVSKAYQVEFNDFFSDDASVVEAYGQQIFLFEGDEKNIKITNKFDLDFANFVVNN